MTNEPLLTIPEITKLLRIDRHTACRLFAAEPGVLIIGNKETRRGQRKYRMLRVPQAVLNRVVARLPAKMHFPPDVDPADIDWCEPLNPQQEPKQENPGEGWDYENHKR